MNSVVHITENIENILICEKSIDKFELDNPNITVKNDVIISIDSKEKQVRSKGK